MHTPRSRFLGIAVVVVAMVGSVLAIAGPAAAATTTVVKPSSMNGWYFWNDATDLPGGPGELVTGPATPPLGVGSVRLGPLTTASGDGAHSTIATNAYFGTDLADISSLSYSTYQPGPVLAVALQFDIRYRTTDVAYGGRLVFEPYQNGAVTVGSGWQSWSPLGGTWWASKITAAGTGGTQVVPLPAGNCGQATPCTWAEINAAFPDAQIFGRLLLKVGSNWLGFDGNADALTVGVSGTDTTFDFEPETQCTTTCYADAVNGNDASGGDTIATAKKTIQAAIDQVSAGGEVRVLPGAYNESAPNSAPTSLGGTYQFGLFFGSAKPGVTLQGVTAADADILNAGSVQATINTNATNNFGFSGIFVEAADTTIRGVEIGPNTPSDNKTIEVVGDNFRLEDSRTAVPGGGSLYINDFSLGGTVLKDYHVVDSVFPDGTSIDISSGAGSSTPLGASNREILGNQFDLQGNTWNAISFNGSGTGVPWFTNTVGGAVITGNSFTGGAEQYIRARGTYPNAEFDWQSFWNDNTYDKAAVALVTESPFDVRTYSYTSGPYTFNDVRRIGSTIEGEVTHAVSGDTVLVKPGLYPEHVTVDKPLTLKGANAGTPGNGVRGPESRITGDVSGALQMTADDTIVDGFEIQSASNNLGSGIHMAPTISGAEIKNNLITGNQIGIYANGDGPSLITLNLFDANNEPGSAGGSGIYSEFTNGLTVDDNEFSNHTENNPIIFGATGAGVHQNLAVTNNTLENTYGIYALAVAGGTFTGNDITAPSGTALSFSGGDVGVAVNHNLLHDSLRGVRVNDGGFGLGDNSDIVVNRNSITGNSDFGIGNLSGYTGTLDATCNWYGGAAGPNQVGTDTVVGPDPVTFAPWLLTSNLDGPCALNTAPTVDAGGPYTVDEGSSVAISGTASDPDAGDTVTTTWSIAPNDGNCTITDPSALSTTVSCDDGPAGSPYTLTLEATDDGIPSETGSDTASLTVANVAPTVTSITRTPPDVLVGDTVTWTATADDVSNADDAAGFQYAFNGGGYGPVNADTFTTSYSTCGTYSVTVTAKDKDGGVSAPATSTATVNVYDGLVLPPLALGVDNLVQKGQVVPVKIRISCNGVPLNGLTPAIQLLKGDKTGQPNDAPDEVITESVSGADTTGVMRNIDSMYLYNLRVPTAINGVGLVKGNQLTIRIRPFAPGNTTSRIDIVLQIRK